MKVQLEKSFPMPASADTAWVLLQDIEGVATCMPGAAITARTDATHYKGTVSVRLGPANMLFRGEIEVAGLDAASHSVHLIGKGQDSTGASAATLDLTARVEPVDAKSCTLVGNSEVSMAGKAASLGGRLMVPVADQVLKQFAANFANKVQAMQAQATASPPPPAGEGQGGGLANTEPQSTSTQQPASPHTAPPTATGSTAQLNGLALVWAILKDWLRSLFGGKR